MNSKRTIIFAIVACLLSFSVFGCAASLKALRESKLEEMPAQTMNRDQAFDAISAILTEQGFTLETTNKNDNFNTNKQAYRIATRGMKYGGYGKGKYTFYLFITANIHSNGDKISVVFKPSQTTEVQEFPTDEYVYTHSNSLLSPPEDKPLFSKEQEKGIAIYNRVLQSVCSKFGLEFTKTNHDYSSERIDFSVN